MQGYRVRYSMVIILSAMFALSGVLLPIVLKSKSFLGLLMVYFCIQFIGRVIQVLMVPILTAIRHDQSPALFRLSTPLLSEGCRKRIALDKVWEKQKQAMSVEIVVSTIIPQVIGMVLRTGALLFFYPLHRGLTISVFMFTPIFIIGVSLMTRKIQKHLDQANQKENYLLQQSILQQMMGGRYIQRRLCQNQYTLVTKQEGIKVILGLVGFIILAVSQTYSEATDMMQTLLWLGYGEHIWSLWGALVQIQVAPKKAGYIKPSLRDISSISVQDLYLANGLGPINFTLVRGSCIQIKGDNGVGKTLLLKTLLGEAPYKGSLICEGESGSLRHGDKLMILGSHSRIVSGRVCDYYDKRLDNLGLYPYIQKLPSRDQTSIEEAYEHWSLGIIQLFGLHYSCQTSADIWFLDEACSHLAYENELLVYQAIRSLPNRPMILYVSHQMANRSLEGARSLYLKQNNGENFNDSVEMA